MRGVVLRSCSSETRPQHFLQLEGGKTQDSHCFWLWCQLLSWWVPPSWPYHFASLHRGTPSLTEALQQSRRVSIKTVLARSMEQHAPTNLPFISPAVWLQGRMTTRKSLPGRIPALQMLACLLDLYSTTVSPSQTTPVPHQCSSSPTHFSSNSVSFSAWICSSCKTFWSMRSISSGHPQYEGSEMTQTFFPFLHPSSYIPLLYKEAFTHGPPPGNLNQPSSTKLPAWPVISVASLNKPWQFCT